METPKNKQQKRKIAGWATAIGVHAVIVVLLLIFGFVTPLPRPEPEGISVDLGVPDVGGPDNSASMSTPTNAASSGEQGAEATETSDNPALPENPTNNNNKPNITPPDKTISNELDEYSKKLAEIAAKRKEEEGKGKGKGKTPGEEGKKDGTEGKDLGGGKGIDSLNGLSSGRIIRNEPTITVDDQSLCGKHLEVLVKVAPSGRVEDVEIRGIAESKTDVYNKKLYEQAVRDIKANATYTPSNTNEYQKATITITIQCR